MTDETTEQLTRKIDGLEKEIKELKEDHGDAGKYAGIGSRVAAAIIDIVLISVLWVIIVIIESIVPLGDVISGLLIVIMSLFAPFAYFTVLEGGIGKGQTIGKRLLHIKVIGENGETPSYFQSFIRTFTRFLDLYLISHIIGLIVASLTERRQRVGDLLAKTLVVKEDVKSPPKSKAEKKSTAVILAVFVIFAVAVLVVLIVGIVLWQLGIFNLGGSSKTFTGFGEVKPLSWGIPASGSGVATMVNGEGADIYPANCTVTGVMMTSCKVSTAKVPAGDEFRINFTDCSGGIAGSPYEATLSINYNKTIGTVTEEHSSTGNIRGPYE